MEFVVAEASVRLLIRLDFFSNWCLNDTLFVALSVWNLFLSWKINRCSFKWQIEKKMKGSKFYDIPENAQINNGKNKNELPQYVDVNNKNMVI